MKNVFLYVLSDGIHPNNYEYNPTNTMKNITIKKDEFDRLFSYINKA